MWQRPWTNIRKQTKIHDMIRLIENCMIEVHLSSVHKHCNLQFNSIFWLNQKERALQILCWLNSILNSKWFPIRWMNGEENRKFTNRDVFAGWNQQPLILSNASHFRANEFLACDMYKSSSTVHSPMRYTGFTKQARKKRVLMDFPEAG